MSSATSRFSPRAGLRDQSAHAGVQDHQAVLNEAPERRTAESAPTAESSYVVENPSYCSDSSDEVLLSLVCSGDREALATLFLHYARIVRGLAYRVLRDASEADDLLQDIFLLVHRLCSTFDSSKGSARFWILQMTYRRAISRRRYLTSRHFYNSVDIEDLAETLKDLRTENRCETSLAGLLGAERMEQAFEALSEGQRQTLRLHFFEGYTLKEIASKLGQSRGNIKHHYFRGLDRLRKQVFGGKL
jgi:RNA polymerase sigma-70 factor, ECF subfamily